MTNSVRTASRRTVVWGVALVLMCSYLMFAHTPMANAVPPLTKSFVRYDTLEQSAQTTGRVCFQIPAASFTLTSIAVTFPTNNATNYTLGTGANFTTTNTNNLDSTQTAVPSAQMTSIAAVVAGQTVTWTFGTAWGTGTQVTADLYCFNWSNNASLKLPNNSTETAPGTISLYAAGPTLEYQSNFSYSAALITNNQVVVSAVVPPSFSLTLSGNTDTFTTANLGTASYNITTGRTLGVTTNAASGFILWAQDTNYRSTGVTDAGSSPANEHGALTSATASYAISNDTNSTSQKNISGTVNGAIASHLFTGTNEDYGLQSAVTTAGTGYGTATANAAYIATTAGYAGTLNPTYYEPIASDTGTANGAVVTVKELASISGNTPAASDYTDTINFTGSGSF